MILVLTNSGDATADYLLRLCEECRLPYARLDTDLLNNLEYGSINLSLEPNDTIMRCSLANITFTQADVATVWYRRPGGGPVDSSVAKLDASAHFIQRESREAWNNFLAFIPWHKWINYPPFIVQASHKFEQLTRARSHGLRCPSTIVTKDPALAFAFLDNCESGTIVKPLSHGLVGDSLPLAIGTIFTSEITVRERKLIEGVSTCPTLFQERIDKEYDVRVTSVDGAIMATKLVAPPGHPIDVRWNGMRDVRHEPIPVPDTIRNSIIGLVASYNLRFAALDFAVDHEGNWIFLELNPNGQWAWIEQRCSQPLAQLFLNSFRIDLLQLSEVLSHNVR